MLVLMASGVACVVGLAAAIADGNPCRLSGRSLS
jgi:hypothetical protein